jgi:hypothetical protein
VHAKAVLRAELKRSSHNALIDSFPVAADISIGAAIGKNEGLYICSWVACKLESEDLRRYFVGNR